jgi:pyridoxine 4-dehydrogenase
LPMCGPNGWGQHASPERAIAVLRTAAEAGVNFIDTADAYGPFVAEDLIATALYPYPEGLVIATKGGQVRDAENWTPLGRPEYLRQCVEMSLRRLKLDRIDLYQLHRIDPSVPLDDQFGLLREMQAEGKIRHIGLSEVTVEQLTAIRAIVDVVSVQNMYSLGAQAHTAVRLVREQLAIAFIPWYPLVNGALIGTGGLIDRLAQKHGATDAQIALAWILRHSPITVLIPGTTSLDHLAENLRAAEIELDQGDLDALNAVHAASSTDSL